MYNSKRPFEFASPNPFIQPFFPPGLVTKKPYTKNSTKWNGIELPIQEGSLEKATVQNTASVKQLGKNLLLPSPSL